MSESIKKTKDGGSTERYEASAALNRESEMRSHSSTGSDEWEASMKMKVRHLRDERHQLRTADYFGKVGYELDGQITGIYMALEAHRKFTENGERRHE